MTNILTETENVFIEKRLSSVTLFQNQIFIFVGEQFEFDRMSAAK